MRTGDASWILREQSWPLSTTAYYVLLVGLAAPSGKENNAKPRKLVVEQAARVQNEREGVYGLASKPAERPN
jgi:hypothetical protein